MEVESELVFGYLSALINSASDSNCTLTQSETAEQVKVIR